MFLHLHVLENYFHSYTFIFLFSFFFKYVIPLYNIYGQCDVNLFPNKIAVDQVANGF